METRRDYKDKIEELEELIIKKDERIEELEETVDNLKDDVADFETDIDNLTSEVENLEDIIEEFKQKKVEKSGPTALYDEL